MSKDVWVRIPPGAPIIFFQLLIESNKMITINISRDDAIYLQAILQSDKSEYCDGIISLEGIKQTDPDRLIGKRLQTPSEAIETTQKAISVLDRVLEQLAQNI